MTERQGKEPTIDELIEYLERTSAVMDVTGFEYSDDQDEVMRQAIRAILEKHKTLEERGCDYECPVCGVKTHLIVEPTFTEQIGLRKK